MTHLPQKSILWFISEGFHRLRHFYLQGLLFMSPDDGLRLSHAEGLSISGGIFIRIMGFGIDSCNGERTKSRMESAMVNFKSLSQLFICYTRSSIPTYFLGGRKGEFSLLFRFFFIPIRRFRIFSSLSGGFSLFLFLQLTEMIDTEGPPSYFSISAFIG
jgi:hypothetical protein